LDIPQEISEWGFTPPITLGYHEPPTHGCVENGYAHPLQVLPGLGNSGLASVNSREVLLDGGDDSSLFEQWRQQYGRFIERLPRDVDHSRSVRLAEKIAQNVVNEVLVKPLVYERLNLEYVLVEECFRPLPEEGAECGCPRNKQVAGRNEVSFIDCAVEVVELGRRSSQVLNAYDRTPDVSPFLGFEASAVNIATQST
jgi:hypothetical protein